MDFKQFKPSSWAIDNKTAIYISVFIISLMGIRSYNSLPKESFPDIVVPKFFISTVYAGNSPSNIENTITKHLEKKLIVNKIRNPWGKMLRKINSEKNQKLMRENVEKN